MTLIDLDAIQETLSEVAKKKHERLSVADEIITMLENKRDHYNKSCCDGRFSKKIRRDFRERTIAFDVAIVCAKAIKAKSEVGE